MLAISLKSGITRNPNHLLPGTSLGIYEERKIYLKMREEASKWPK
jgi:hypothetical protein